MDWKSVQQRLGVTADGVPGPATYTALFRAMGADANVGASLGRAAAQNFPECGITTALRIAHFLAQSAHETGGYRFFVEIWGPTAAQRGYEGRRDLGNTQPGDGVRYKGRGIFQLTGRANYAHYGLADTPEKAADPEIALRIACQYWRERGMAATADADDIRATTRKVNGGTVGLLDRTARLNKAKGILGC